MKTTGNTFTCPLLHQLSNTYPGLTSIKAVYAKSC